MLKELFSKFFRRHNILSFIHVVDIFTYDCPFYFYLILTILAWTHFSWNKGKMICDLPESLPNAEKYVESICELVSYYFNNEGERINLDYYGTLPLILLFAMSYYYCLWLFRDDFSIIIPKYFNLKLLRCITTFIELWLWKLFFHIDNAFGFFTSTDHFPKVGFCNISVWSDEGTRIWYNLTCQMVNNTFNKCIYVILWTWLSTLLFLNVLSLAFCIYIGVMSKKAYCRGRG